MKILYLTAIVLGISTTIAKADTDAIYAGGMVSEAILSTNRVTMASQKDVEKRLDKLNKQRAKQGLPPETMATRYPRF
jgi:hypothetical protein